MKGFWKSATFLRWWTLLALGTEGPQQQQMKAAVGLGLRGARSRCDRCQSALTAARFSCRGFAASQALAAITLDGIQERGKAGGLEPAFGGHLAPGLVVPRAALWPRAARPLCEPVSSSVTGRGWARPVLLHPGGAGPRHDWCEKFPRRFSTAGWRPGVSRPGVYNSWALAFDNL